MNTKKLLKTINDILLLEDKNNLQANLNSILNFYTQNQPEQLNETKEKIYSIIKDSILFNYVNSDFKILKTIEVYGYFDFSLKEKIELILSSQSHEVQQKMTSFVNKRAELLKKLRALKSALDGLSVNADIINDEAYYVIFSFPNKYHNLDELQKGIKDVNVFLREIVSTSKNAKDYKISSVNDGCIEFFIETGEFLANTVSIAVDYILEIYACVKLYEDGLNRYKNYKKKRKTQLEKIEKEEMEERKEELLNEFIKTLELKKPEEESRIRVLFLQIVKHFEQGVSVEVKTPLIEEPQEIAEDDDPETIQNIKAQEKLYKQKLEIDERNKKLFLAQQDGFLLELPNEEKNKS